MSSFGETDYDWEIGIFDWWFMIISFGTQVKVIFEYKASEKVNYAFFIFIVLTKTMGLEIMVAIQSSTVWVPFS